MHRLLRHAATLILILISVYAWGCLYAYWSGTRHWAQVKAMLQSEGETIEFARLFPPRVDEATNFCAIEALDGIALEGDEQSPQGRKRKALVELGWTKKASTGPLIAGGRAWGHKSDLAAWARFARDTGFIQMPPDSGNAARDLLLAIDRSQPLIKVLADAAVSHPNAGFTPSLRDRPLPSLLFNLTIAYGNAAQNAERALVLRALAANECGDGAAAVSSVLAMLRLCDALSWEPCAIPLLVSLSAHELAEEAVWSILEKHAVTESELQAVQGALQKLQFDIRALAAVRGELAMGIQCATYMQAGAGNRSGSLRNYPMPWGVLDENKAVIAHLEYEGLIKPLKAGGYANLIHHVSAMEDELQSHCGLLHPTYIIAHLAVPAFSGLGDKIFEMETVRRQGIIACSLERYYLQHHAYPASLLDLVPVFLAAVPADPMDDHSMRYRRTSDGRYMIWSVGFDQKDDNGKVNIEPKDKFPARERYKRKRSYKGDWTWQYQPIK